MLQSVDFSTVYITSIRLAAARQLASYGVGLAQVGFDSSDNSDNVLATLLAANYLWDAYRFMSWDLPPSQVQSCIDGIHTFTPTNAQLPGFLWCDLEENTDGQDTITLPAPADPAAYFDALIDYVESRGITADPNSLVKPGVYTRLSWWQAYVPAGYTGFADHGWSLWVAQDVDSPDQATLFGGWKQEQVQGVQCQWDVSSPIGTVDVSIFRNRVTVVNPPPPVPPPTPPTPPAPTPPTGGSTLSPGLVSALDVVAARWPQERPQ